ncbi:MAG: alanine--tRNA ligase, partial [Actinobacteria bacterium]|nr:alanine--tRNA ligase [Actinomycetota bacterium]
MDVRKIFLNYFEKNDHLILPSSSLIPEDDPSVLLTTAGMQQFKPYFLGIKKPPGKRITTVQKCFRTSDIDRVGYTEKHLTFFEMLGNFSFGDYFKEEAIKYSLDFILNTLKIPLEKLLVAVFKGDKDIPADLESIERWKENGISADKIYKFGKEENFWGPAGETGPCGPCTEIFYDFGKEYGCGKDSCNPNCGCSRFFEIWNLVFIQYNFDGKKYNELPQKNIDTGMGL